VSIRRHRHANLTLDDLVELGSLTPEAAQFCRSLVHAGRTILVSGGTSTGKTTFLRALCNEIPAWERLIVIEKDLAELALAASPRHPDVVELYSRQANVEGEGEVTVAELVRGSLRMNPSRVIVGEVLGDEVIPMLNAMSQGNEGSMCTIHADSSHGAFIRLASYAVQAPERLEPAATHQLIAGAVHFVIHLTGERFPDRPMHRYVSSIREVQGLTDHGTVASSEVLSIDATGRLTPAAALNPRHRDLLARFGWDPTRHLRSIG
jgi:Flp pilus assembly CpaF family ATPase